MDDQDHRFSISADIDETFDRLVCRVSAQLELGHEFDRAELQQLDPKHATRLLELLPTLKEMARLRPSSQSTAAKRSDVADEIVNGLLGDFRIQREVGRGGMGVVYEAQQISLGRRVAIKILPFAGVLDPRRMQRFQNEARAAASLHHPHIVPVFSVGCERGVHFYAMQFIDGQSLEKVVQARRRDRKGTDAAEIKADRWSSAPRRGTPSIASKASANESELDVSPRFTPPRQSSAEPATVPIAKGSTERSQPNLRWTMAVAETISNVADALHHAHQAGVIHRDIKPSNLMFDAVGKIWVTDFGLAHIESNETLTVSGDLLGTLRYMSPEQAGGQACQVDYRSDIYSVGVTLYELLTLEPAFPGRDRKQLLHDILHCEPPSLRKWDHTLPVELEIIVAKAMAKDPTDRYQTAAAMADDLRRFLQNEPIVAHRPSTWQRISKWTQQNAELMATAVGGLLILGLGALIATIVLWQQANRLSIAFQEAEQAKIAAQNDRQIADSARAKESAARELAMQHADEAKTTLSFFERYLLAAPRPTRVDGGYGRDITLRQAIDQVLPMIERDFRHQPATEINLRRVLGVTYSQLAEYEIAREQFQRSYDVAVAHFGPTDITTLGALVNLGQAHQRCGNLIDAEKHLQAAWGPLHRTHPNHRFTETCLAHLAELDRARGKLDDTVEKYERVVESSRNRVGDEHRDIITAQMNLANVYAEIGRLPEAKKMLQEIVAFQTTRYGDGHPETWNALNFLATVEADFGDLAAATLIHKKLLDQKQAILGDDHLSTLGARVNLAMTLRASGDTSTATSLLESAVPVLRDKYPRDEFTLNGMNALAGVWAENQKTAEAMHLYRATLALSMELRGPEHFFTLGVRVNMANQWHRAGDSGKAVTAYRQALQLLQKNYPEHEFTRVTLQSLAQVFMETGQFLAAISPLETLLEKQTVFLPQDDRRILETRVQLGNCYRNVGRTNEAQEILEDVMPTLRSSFRGQELLAIAASDLASIHLDQKYTEVAVELFSEAYRARFEERGPNHPSTLGVLVNWGLAEWLRGDLNAAAERMEQALPELRKSHPLHPFLGVCLKQLIGVFEELERTDSEAELLVEFEQWLLKQGGTNDPQTFRVRVRQAQRQGDWEEAQILVQEFESLISDDPSDHCVAAGLRARLAEMAVALHPTDPALVTAQHKRVQAWLVRADNEGADVPAECQFDPALRRYFLQQTPN
jgi:serine/threonine protein kinase/lipopolysaccharide biosynthesis regulator YciM